MSIGGFGGHILHVDLTTQEIEKKEIDPDLARNFVGGYGINAKLGYDLIESGVDPLSPENKIIIGVGPLVGTNVPASSRVCSLTKLPVNGAIGRSGGGGMNFGHMFKHAGYDHLVIKGSADSPVYLKIFDDDVEICNAESLEGKGSGETAEKLYSKYEWPTGVISIGQAGENLVKFSMSFIDNASTLGRGGLGAVMGSKNLKAIIAKGTKDIEVSNEKKYRELVNNLYERMKNYSQLKDAQKYGFLNFMPLMPKEDYLELKKRRMACISCPIADKDCLQVKDGRFEGLVKETTAAVNTLLPMEPYGYAKDYGESIKVTDILDEYGLDMFETFGLLQFADELFKHEKLDEEELGEPGIEFNFDSLTEWIRKIAYREGFGDTLADGFKEVLNEYGDGIEEFEPTVIKGLLAYQGITGPVEWDLFSTFEFGEAVHPKGPTAAPGGSSPLYFTRGRDEDWVRSHLDRQGVPEEAIERIFTPKEGMKMNVGRMEKYSQLFLFACDSLGTCGRGQINRFNSAELQADLYSAVTGIEKTPEELMKGVERAFNLVKAANVREGFGREDDRFPAAWFGEEKHKDYYGDVEITEERAYGMLEDYYEEMGWDTETGKPKKSKLKELDLDYVAEDIGI